MAKLKVKVDNIQVRKYGVKLHIHEIKNISALESRIRTIYELEGLLQESDKAVKAMQAQITLACGKPEKVKQLMRFLKKDSQRVNFIQAYVAGRKSYLAKENINAGFTNYFRELCLSPRTAELSRQFQQCFSAVVSSVQYDDIKCYVTWLVEEYRAMYSKVNEHIDEFFVMGYEYLQLPPNKRRHIPRNTPVLKIDGEEYFIDLIKSSVCGL